jgi:hypothetical protein
MFTLSSDTIFHEIGEISTIPYCDHYMKWQKLLHLGLANDEDHFLELFRHWNQLFFPNGLASTKMSDEQDEPDLDFEESVKLITGGYDRSLQASRTAQDKPGSDGMNTTASNNKDLEAETSKENDGQDPPHRECSTSLSSSEENS